MKLPEVIFGSGILAAAAVIGVGTAVQSDGQVELLAFLQKPNDLVAWGPFLAALGAGLGAFSAIHGLMAKPATKADAEEIKAGIGDAKRAAEESQRAVQAEGATTRVALKEEIRTQTDAQTEMLLKAFEASRPGGVTRDAALIALAKRIGKDVHDPDQALREMEAFYPELRSALKEGTRAQNLDSFVVRVLDRLREKTEVGDLDGAAAEADAAIAQWEREEAERQEASSRAGVALLEAGIRQDTLARRAKDVAAKTLQRLELQGRGTGAELRAGWEEYYERGKDKGTNFDLEVAIELARLLLARATTSSERGTALNCYGNALSVLGERDRDTARLEEAIAAYSSSLEMQTRDQDPMNWAGAQNNLGNVLRELGERESGTARLEAAAAAYQKALEVWTRDRVPMNWAMTQNNLGGTLTWLGERESGTARLESAIAACQLALEEWKRDRVPLDWAKAQNNLGNALRALGEREEGTKRLGAAVQAYNLALEEWTRERFPLDWAAAQDNLGLALTALGNREVGTDRLKAAVAAHLVALEEHTRERVPLLWASTQNNLGIALRTLGERESGTSRLEASVRAYQLALEERTRERVPEDWALTQNNLGNALRALAERESGTARLEAAIEAHRQALEEWSREDLPIRWAAAHNNLGNAQQALGDRGHGVAAWEKAVTHYRLAIEEFEFAAPAYAEVARSNLSSVQEKLAAAQNA